MNRQEKMRAVKNLSYYQLLALFNLEKKEYPDKESIIDEIIRQELKKGQVYVTGN